MIKEEEVYRIGRIGKPHGVKGEVTMQVDDDVFDRVDADFLVLCVDGIMVPFYMEEYRFRTDTTALVKFEDVDTVEQARELTNTDVFFLRRMAEDGLDEEYTWNFFLGYTLYDAATKAVAGTIADIDDSTQNVLFQLENGLLIPAAEELITNIDHDCKTIGMNLPEGLLNL